MRILFVLPEYPPHEGGGLLLYYRHLAPALAARGHRVRVLVAAPFSPAFEDYDHDGVEVRFVPDDLVRERLGGFDRYRPLPDLRRFLAAAGAALEFAEGGREWEVVEAVDWGLGFAPWVLAKEAPPVVVTLHGSAGQIDEREGLPGRELQGETTRLLEAALLPAAAARHTHGRSNAAAWERTLSGTVDYLPPPWRPREEGGEVPEGIPPFTGIVVGRVQEWKGPELLCEALRLLGDGAPRVLWVGRDTPHRSGGSTAEHLAARFPGVWGRTLLPVGPLPPAAVAALQARARFAVVPSTWDVFNLAGAEAMAAGAVLVASEAAGVSDLLEEGGTGFPFPSGDPAALAEGIRRVLALPEEERRGVAEAGREVVLRTLEPTAVAALKERAYEAVAGAGRGPRGAGVSPWVRRAVEPGPPLGDPLAFLEGVPARELTGHLARRTKRRLRGR